MDLNLDALAAAIIEEYKRCTEDKKMVEDFIASVGAKGTYSDVYKLAKNAGLNLEQAIVNQWTFEADEVYFSTIKDLLKKTTGAMHDDIANACKFIQDNMNKAAGIKLKTQLAQVNDYDLGDIAERMKNQGITKLSGELQTLGCKMVDDNQQANMELHTSAGYEIAVTRKYDRIGLRSGTKYAERCKICSKLEGSHQFKSTREARNSGVFARHAGCGCVIDYYSKRTGKTDYNIQNYNIAKVNTEGESTKRKKRKASNGERYSREEEVARNREMLQTWRDFIDSHEDAYGRKETVAKNLENLELLNVNGNAKKVTQNIDNISKKGIIHNRIESPIGQRNTGKGNPNAIIMYEVELNNRQKKLLDELKQYDSRIMVDKKSVNLKDIAALTASTGDEFAIFTNGGRRLVVRGDVNSIGIPDYELEEMGRRGYKLTGHTHPGFDNFCLFSSGGDRQALKLLKQNQSVIYNSRGQFMTFDVSDED